MNGRPVDSDEIKLEMKGKTHRNTKKRININNYVHFTKRIEHETNKQTK